MILLFWRKNSPVPRVFSSSPTTQGSYFRLPFCDNPQRALPPCQAFLHGARQSHHQRRHLRRSQRSGFDTLCELVNSGVNTPGLPMSAATRMPRTFRHGRLGDHQRDGQLRMSKPTHRTNLCFLLKVKCEVVARSLGKKRRRYYLQDDLTLFLTRFNIFFFLFVLEFLFYIPIQEKKYEKQTLPRCVSSTLCYFAHAMQFQTIGYKSVAMGGAAVANSTASTATYDNPALLAKAQYDVEISIGGGASFHDHGVGAAAQELDDSGFLDTLDRLENNTGVCNRGRRRQPF